MNRQSLQRDLTMSLDRPMRSMHTWTQPYVVEERDLLPTRVALVARLIHAYEIGNCVGEMCERVADVLTCLGVGPMGPPQARFHHVDFETFRVEAGFPSLFTYEGSADVYALDIPAVCSAVTWHIGPYDSMVPAYQAISSWLDKEGLDPLGEPWEVYVTDPKIVNDSTLWRTELIQPFVHRSPW
jgi:effector-binding domain-containing protein